jgi:hypothetical protein
MYFTLLYFTLLNLTVLHFEVESAYFLCVTISRHLWLLDFAGFRAEILKNFKAEIPLKDRNDWQDLFTQQQSLIRELSQHIQLAEQQLNRAVYTLFDLTDAEIALIEM